MHFHKIIAAYDRFELREKRLKLLFNKFYTIDVESTIVNGIF